MRERDTERHRLFGTSGAGRRPEVSDPYSAVIRLGASVRRTGAEMRYSWRSLRRDRVYLASAVSSLAIGIGGATTVLSVFLALVFAPLPYHDPDHLAIIQPAPTWELFEQLQSATAFDLVAAYNEQAANLIGASQPERIMVGRVTKDLMRIAEVNVLAGRAFGPADFEPHGEDVALITAGMWRRSYGSADVVGRTISLDDRQYMVVGVTDDSFRAPTQLSTGRGLSIEVGPAVLTPLVRNPVLRSSNATDRMWRGLSVIVHIRNGALAQAIGEVRAAGQSLSGRGSSQGYNIVPLLPAVRGDLPRQMLIVGLAVSLLLLVASVNFVSLAVGYCISHRLEHGARLSFGATRFQLLRLQFVQTAYVASSGGALGLVAAVLGVNLLKTMMRPLLSGLDQVEINTTIVAAGMGLTAGVGAVAAIVIASRTARLNPSEILRGDPVATPIGWLSPSSMVVALQIAVCCVALTVSGVIGSTLLRESRIDFGFQTTGILTADISLSRLRYPTTASARMFFRQLIDQVSAIPGVDGASLAVTVPGGSSTTIANITVADDHTPVGSESPDDLVRYETVTANYFKTLSIKSLAGGSFDDADTQSGEPVAVVNSAFARRHWISPSASIGKRVAFGRRQFAIIGVVQDIRGIRLRAEPTVYFIYDQFPQSPTQLTIFLRSKRNPVGLTEPLRQVLRTTDPNQPLYNIMTLERIVFAPLARLKLIGAITIVFALLAVSLCALGMYSTMSRSVISRHNELAVRVAVGSSPERLMWSVMKSAGIIFGAGVCLGLPAAYGTVRLLQAQIVGVESLGPLVAGVALFAAAVATALGAIVPAIRAARSDASVLLRRH